MASQVAFLGEAALAAFAGRAALFDTAFGLQLGGENREYLDRQHAQLDAASRPSSVTEIV